nr:Protein F27B10.1 [Haemonchus contortus]
MWWPLIAAILIHLVIVQPAQGYSRFGGNGDELRYVKGIPLSINDQILRGSNIHYYGRFRSGQDDVLNRFFHRFA